MMTTVSVDTISPSETSTSKVSWAVPATVGVKNGVLTAAAVPWLTYCARLTDGPPVWRQWKSRA